MSILKARGRTSSALMMFARNWSRIAFLAELFVCASPRGSAMVLRHHL
jgi:hypothetical protein